MVRLTDILTKLSTVILLVSLSNTIPASTVNFSAIIGTDTAGCSISVPESNLWFKALRIRDLTGSVTTHEIKPLKVVLSCTDTTETVTPSLSITGTTPYSGVENTVFLDGVMNGVGFMVRQSDDIPLLATYYSTDNAIKNNGRPLVLGTLNKSNGFYREEGFWVGLVGPFGDSIVPGPFSSALIVNVIFQ